MANQLRHTLTIAIQRAGRAAETIALGGLGPREYGEHPYAGLLRVLREAITHVETLTTHEHEWNEDAFCTLCGADGRA